MMMNVHDLIVSSVFIGVGATIVMDVVAIILKRVFDISSLNYSLVGRWIGYFSRGKFMHQSVAELAPIKGETALGWTAHYCIGITFAFLMLLIWGDVWLLHPTIILPIVYGIATTLASWVLMQPAFGQGLAASNTPHPWKARARSLMTHAIYGWGIYIAAWCFNSISL